MGLALHLVQAPGPAALPQALRPNVTRARAVTIAVATSATTRRLPGKQRRVTIPLRTIGHYSGRGEHALQ